VTVWSAAHSAALFEARVVGVNFHDIAAENRAEVRGRLRRASELGPSLDPDDGQGEGVPGIFVAFYDGYHDTGLFGAELCADLGIRAFFFPIFASADPARATLTDSDLKQIATVHELCFHSTSHFAAAQVTPDSVAREVFEPVERIRSITGSRPRVGACRGGTRFDERNLGDRTLRELGLRYLVSNWSIEAVPSASASLRREGHS